MPLPSPSDYSARIKAILQSVQPLPDEAKAPILHYQRAVADVWGSLGYVDRLVAERDRYQAVVDRHLGRLRGMALVNLVEAFERFLKEVAAECVDRLAELVVDDRFNEFPVQGATLASHFGSGSPGRALCESSLWLNCKDINDRFRKLLSDPQQPGTFYVFPKDNQQPADQTWRYDLVSLIWQIRHTSIHNVGVITRSDAIKLRVLSKTKVDAPRVLVPTKIDLRWLKAFLDDTVEVSNKRIGERLADLLTTIHTDSGGPFAPQAMADLLAAGFRLPLVVAGATGVVPVD
jgi:hypothetical protein